MGDVVRRPRGRPKGGTSSARSRIVDAASSEFGDKGYDATSMRGIARRAGVDARLVHHYFADKAALLAEAVRLPLRPDTMVRNAIAGPIDGLGARLARAVLETWEMPVVQPAAVALMRSGVGTAAGGRLVREFLGRELIGAIAERLDGERDDARRRASLAASQVAGVLVMRYLVHVEPLASMPVEQLVERIGPVLQHHLTGATMASEPSIDIGEDGALNSSHDE